MNAHPNITGLIAAHLAAVHVDDQSFTEDGIAIDAALAEKTGADEREAFVAFASAPCRTADEVQEKVRYVVDGTVGPRDTLLICLDVYGDDLRDKFLRSLIVEPPKGITTADNPADPTRGSCACAPSATRVCACEEGT